LFGCERHRVPVYRGCSWLVLLFPETSQTYRSGRCHLQQVSTSEQPLKSVSSGLIWLSAIQPQLSQLHISRVTFKELLIDYLSKRKQVIYNATLGWTTVTYSHTFENVLFDCGEVGSVLNGERLE
jgi:hypothetical protein